MFEIEEVNRSHRDGWLQLRIALWPDEDAAEMAREVNNVLRVGQLESLVLIATHKEKVVGFAEAVLRKDYVNGCATSPVAFLEGIYVSPECRHWGIARELVANVQRWAADMGCKEFASDALLENTDSHAMHTAGVGL